jgi:hypothetical protein
MAPLAAYKVPIPTLRIFPFVHLIPRLAQSLVFEKYGGFRLSKCISYCYIATLNATFCGVCKTAISVSQSREI